MNDSKEDKQKFEFFGLYHTQLTDRGERNVVRAGVWRQFSGHPLLILSRKRKNGVTYWGGFGVSTSSTRSPSESIYSSDMEGTRRDIHVMFVYHTQFMWIKEEHITGRKAGVIIDNRVKKEKIDYVESLEDRGGVVTYA